MKGGIPPRHEVQPQTIEEESLVAAADEEWSTVDDEEFVAVPDYSVARDVSTPFVISRVVLILMLPVAFGDLPYAYYQLLRVVAFGVGAWGIYEAHHVNQKPWRWVFGAIAFVFNPFEPLNLSREAWAAVDLLAVAALIGSLRYVTPVRDVPEIRFPWWKVGPGEPIWPADWPDDEPPPIAQEGPCSTG